MKLGGSAGTTAKPQQSAAPKKPAPKAAPKADKAAPKPQPKTTTPPFGKLFGGAFDGLSKRVTDLKETIQPTVTPEQRKAMEYVHKQLEPNKLGGNDRTFNFADRDAIVSGLMRDKAGLKQEVQGQLQAEGKGFQAWAAGRGIDGKKGPIAKAAKRKIDSEAPQQIRQQLEQGLVEAKIDPATGKQPDTVRRNLTFSELREFEKNAKVLQDMQEEIEKKLGMNIEFPGGLSQKSIEHSLNGKFGVPPGGVLTPRTGPK